uniref:Uncharacterized protein n=1 Tax=Anopheles merus TaxID=30066 RepID=A0A182USJ6_ANOME
MRVIVTNSPALFGICTVGTGSPRSDRTTTGLGMSESPSLSRSYSMSSRSGSSTAAAPLLLCPLLLDAVEIQHARNLGLITIAFNSPLPRTIDTTSVGSSRNELRKS